MASINLSQLINESLMTESENEENSPSEDSGSKLKSALDWGRNKYDSAKQKVQAFGQNHPDATKRLKYGTAATLGTAALGGAGYFVKKGLDRRRAAKAAAEAERHPMNQAKAFATKHGKKIAAGTLAALGAGVGVKALLKYLRKKKS